jgi:hypothetical protein
LKSRSALILNGYELSGEFLAFWTFTFRNVLPVDVARQHWMAAVRKLRKHFGSKLVGLRAFELHPGGHGLHIHVVTPEWLPVNEVRMVLCRVKGQPFGRIDVQPGDSHAGHYLAKYISKARRPKCLKGVRLWDALDRKAFNYTRVADVVIKTLFSECYRAAKKAWNWTGNKGFFDRFRVVHRFVQLTIVSGCEAGKWPGGDEYSPSDPAFLQWFNSIPTSA